MAQRAEETSRILYKVDSALIQLTNFRPHPTDGKYMVFMFYDDAIADHFERLLGEEGIAYERNKDEENKRPRYLFAIKRTHLEMAIHLNYTAHGKNRRPSLNHSGLRWVLMIFIAALVGICLFAYITYGVKN